MIYNRTEAPTVREYIKGLSKDKIWMCPELVHSPKFNQHPLLAGLECTRSTVPKILLDKKVIECFYEGGLNCIFWDNSREFEEELNVTFRRA